VAQVAQGTIAEFDETGHTGVVLLDDGTIVRFPAAAFTGSGLRFLRQGQRVHIDRDAQGTVTRVTLFTLA
jgi:2-phospho-L-lactate guanylyltransferase